MSSALAILKMGAPALQKAGTIIFQKIARLQKIDAALREIPDDGLLKTAVNDFEVVKGSWRGEFTETLDRFLRSFEASGLSTAMFNSALLGQRSPALQSLFVEFFKAETGQSDESGQNLFQQISSSFEITVERISHDPVMIKVIRSGHQELFGRLVTIEAALDHISSGISHGFSSDTVTDVIPRILRAAVGDTKFIRVETSQGRRDVEINKIYISPNLQLRSPEKINSAARSVAESQNQNPRGVAAFEITSAPDQLKVREYVSRVYIDDVSNIPRVVVLGNPGGGKSTLLQSVCHRVATESLKSISDGSSPNEVIVPIRIILRDYESARHSNPQLNLLDFIVNDILHSAYADKSTLQKTIYNLLSSGKIYLAFDGLDEILKTADRRKFVDLVNKFVRQYPLCNVLVTSREVGYEKAPLPHDDYSQLILGDFIESDVQLYAERFIKHVGRKKAAEARESANHFMQQTANNAQDLRKNPLMLGLMMWIFNIRDDVPSNRPEIYQECSRLMFERWDSERGIIVDLPQTFDRLQVFTYLASKIFEDSDLASGVPAKWIEHEIKSHLSEVLESVQSAQAAAKSLVQFIVDRSWVMSEKGEGVFSFTHQTFLEYFFAKHMDDAVDTVDELLDQLFPHIKLEEWDVVSRLALQIKTDRNRRRQDQAISRLISTLQSSSNDEELRAISGFAIRCLEFLSASETHIRDLVENILNSLLQCYRSGDTACAELFPNIFQGARERRTFIVEVVEQWLAVTFEQATDEGRDFVLALVDGVTGKYGAFGSTQLQCGAIPAHLQRRLRGKLLPTLATEAHTNPKSARIFYEWTGTIQKIALAKFGPAFIHYSRPAKKFNISGAAALVLAASGEYPNLFDETNFSVEKARSGLITFGSHWRRVGIDDLEPYPDDQDLNDPPIGIWIALLKAMKSDPDMRVGALVALLLSFRSAQGRNSHPEYPELISEIRRYGKLLSRAREGDAAAIANAVLDKLLSAFPEERGARARVTSL